jgi:WD40 repeat protein
MPTRHDAFISYSHAADARLAAALEAGLEKLAKPMLKLRAMDVFRDQTSLTAAPALWPGIVAHLEASEWFLLLASPQSALSVWCNKEVQWWLDNRSPDRMLVLLTDGDIVWDRTAHDFDWSRTTSLPRLLEGRCADEPLYVDVRWARSSELLTLRNATFRDAVVSVAAPIRGVPKDELDGADLRQLARNRRLVRGGVAAITLAAAIAMWQAVVANRQRIEAERQRDIAVSRQLSAQAELMRMQQPDRLPLALLMAAQALRGQPESIEAQQTLRGLLARSPEPVAAFAHTAPVTFARLSRDLAHLATAAEADAGAVWSVRDGARVVALPGADRTVVWSADDTLIAGCCAQVTVWNRAGEPQLHLTEKDLNGRAQNIVLSADGRYLAVGFRRDRVSGFSVHHLLSRAIVLRQDRPGEFQGIPIEFAPNGDFFSALLDGVEWYPAGQWERPRKLNAGREVVHLAVSPDSAHLAVASRSSVSLVNLHQPAERLALASTRFGPSDIEDVMFDASGAYVGARTGMGAAAIWHVGTGREIAHPTHGDFYTINALSFSPIHREALSCATDGNCFTWSLVDGRRLRQFSHVYAYQTDRPADRALGGGEYGATGALVATSGRDMTARLWKLSDAAQEPAKRCDWSTPYISTHVAMSTSWHLRSGPRDPADAACATRIPELSRGVVDTDSTQQFAAMVADKREIHVWNLREHRLMAKLVHEDTTSDAGDLRVLAISRTGRRVATFRKSSRTMRIWDAGTSKSLLHEALAEPDPPKIEFLGDDAAVRIDQRQTLSVIDLGKLTTRWSTSAADLVAFTVSDNGSRLAALALRNSGAVLRLWDSTSGDLLLERALDFRAGEVKLDRSGKHIVVLGDSPVVPEVPPQPAEVLVLDIATRRALVELPKSDGTIALDLARDGSRLAAVSRSGELRLWELPGAKVQRAVLATPGPVTFSADGQWIAAGGGPIRVLDASTLRPASQFDVSGVILALEFQADDALLAVRSRQQSQMTLDAYRWRTEDLLAEACKRLPLEAAARQWAQLLPGEPVPMPCAAAPRH